MEVKGKYLKWIFLVVSLICFSLAGFMIHSFSGKWKSGAPTTVAGPALSFKKTEAKAVTPEKPAGGSVSSSEWVLYVTGEVSSPGIYHLPSGTRAYQLVEAAGGLTSRADETAVNLASSLSDGDHFHVPPKQVHTAEVKVSGTAKARTGGGIVVSSLPSPSQKNYSSHKSSSHGGLINVNAASAKELEQLPGIGPRTAEKIVAYRQNVGSFRTKEELMKVRGIGSKKLEAIIEMITIR